MVSNLAEGFERESNLEKVRFYGFAKASAGEVRAQSLRVNRFVCGERRGAWQQDPAQPLKQTERAKKIDRYCRVIFPVIFAIASIAIFVKPRD